MKGRSYAGYFKAMWDTAAGVVRLQCLVGGGCKGKPVSYHVVGKSGEHTFPFANAYNHLLAGGRSCCWSTSTSATW